MTMFTCLLLFFCHKRAPNELFNDGNLSTVVPILLHWMKNCPPGRTTRNGHSFADQMAPDTKSTLVQNHEGPAENLRA